MAIEGHACEEREQMAERGFEGSDVETATSKSGARKRICVLCVGNKLMLDDGIGPAVYEELMENYDLPDNVDVFDVGCLGMDMISWVGDYDFFISVDAVDGTDAEPGEVFRYAPDDIARHSGPVTSLHEMKLADLFDAASLLGLQSEGVCYGMQVENMSPAEFTVGLTPRVFERLPYLTECVVAELDRQGCPLSPKRA